MSVKAQLCICKPFLNLRADRHRRKWFAVMECCGNLLVRELPMAFASFNSNRLAQKSTCFDSIFSFSRPCDLDVSQLHIHNMLWFLRAHRLSHILFILALKKHRFLMLFVPSAACSSAYLMVIDAKSLAFSQGPVARATARKTSCHITAVGQQRAVAAGSPPCPPCLYEVRHEQLRLFSAPLHDEVHQPAPVSTSC